MSIPDWQAAILLSAYTNRLSVLSDTHKAVFHEGGRVNFPRLPNLDRIALHRRVAFSYSGGKDSTAVALMLRNWHDRVTVYHVDTGDLLPEISESVARVAKLFPNFVRIETHVADWHRQHGLPTDLLPHTQDPIGAAMGENDQATFVPRYLCCAHNLMNPLWYRIQHDKCTMLIRGTKRVDMARLPAWSGQVHDGVELFYPLEDWTNENVFAYLKSEGFPLPPLYRHMTNAPECARCSAWWGEHRAEYLRANYPDLYRDYQARLAKVMTSLERPLANLAREIHRS